MTSMDTRVALVIVVMVYIHVASARALSLMRLALYQTRSYWTEGAQALRPHPHTLLL